MIFKAPYSFPVFDPETEGGSAAPVEPAAGAPEALPGGQPAGSPKESAEGGDVDFVLEAFEQLNAPDADEIGEFPSGEAESGQKAPAAQQVKEVEAPATATAAAEPKAQQVPTAPEPKPAEAPSANQTQQADASASSPVKLEPEKILDQLSEEVSKHRDTFQKVLAEQTYTMTPQELEEFTEDPAKVIGRVAAKVHVNVVESLSKMFAQQMPMYVHGLMQARARNDERESAFWSANPGLDPVKHRDIVTNIAGLFRKMNPNADAQTVISTVGRMAMAALDLTAQATVGAANAQANVQTPGKVVRPAGQQPFLPAGVSTAPPNSQARPPENPWSAFTREMEALED